MGKVIGKTYLEKNNKVQTPPAQTPPAQTPPENKTGGEDNSEE